MDFDYILALNKMESLYRGEDSEGIDTSQQKEESRCPEDPIKPPCYLKVDLFPSANLTKREALYLEYNVIYLRMTQALHELTTRTGMPITQENGQRRYGPPLNYKGPPVERGSEIFVGKLPRDMFEDEIVPVFEQAGEIFELRLMMDFSGTNRGYCFVQYYTAEAATKAIKLLNDHEIRSGRFLGVVKSVDNCRLFVGGIPRDKTRDQIYEEMRKVTDGVSKVISNPSPMDRSKNRGYAFIEYENHRAAAMARRKMIPGKIQLWGVTVAVDWAEPEPDVMNLYVRNVTMAVTEEELRNVFDAHSRNGVDKVKKIKDYAFIHFLSRSQAEDALKSLDGSELDGSILEITWAKPVNKVVYKAKKALAKQLYSYGSTGNHAKSIYEGGNSSERIFGQYNSLSCGSNPHQIVYHQISQQYQGHDYGNYPSLQYQNGSLQHDSAGSSRHDLGNSTYGHVYPSAQIVPPLGHSKSLLGHNAPSDRIYGSYSSGHGAPGMYMPISGGHAHSQYRNGPLLAQMTPYMTQLGHGLPYII